MGKNKVNKPSKHNNPIYKKVNSKTQVKAKSKQPKSQPAKVKLSKVRYFYFINTT